MSTPKLIYIPNKEINISIPTPGLTTPDLTKMKTPITKHVNNVMVPVTINIFLFFIRDWRILINKLF